jgi:hypothetical protein
MIGYLLYRVDEIEPKMIKTTEDFIEERNKEDATKNILTQEKFCIELNAI